MLLESLGAVPAVVCGAGLGAVIALDLIMRRSELVSGAVLVEPPLMALLPEATEALSDDRQALQDARGRPRRGGRGRASTSPGRCRRARRRRRAGCPPSLTADARERPAILFAELGAAAGWSMPLLRARRGRAPVADRHRRLDPLSPAGGRRRRWRSRLAGERAARARDAPGPLRTSATPTASPGWRWSWPAPSRCAGATLTSITPPRRASTAPPSSSTARIAVGTAARIVTMTSIA